MGTDSSDDWPLVERPADRPRREHPDARFMRRVIPTAIARSIENVWQAVDATPVATIAVAVVAIVERHTGESGVVIWTRAPTAELVPLRIDHGTRTTFRELLGSARDAFQSAPPVSSASHHPIRVFVSADPDAPMGVDLAIATSLEHDAWTLAATYNADLFEEARVADLLDQIVLWLEQAAQSPDVPVATFSLVTPSAARLLPDPTAVLSDRFFGAAHEVFSKQAARSPDHVAIEDEDHVWTYSELERRANQLAHYLRAAGIGIGDTIAIGADRCAPLVLAMLGAMKSGGAFCTLDPTYPDAKICQLIGALRPRAWLRVGDFPEPSTAVREALRETTVVQLDLASDLLFDAQPSPPPVSIGPDDIAYVAFTSGSTGEPKGVLGRHGSLSHFVPWLARTFELGPSDRFSMLAGLAHDPLHRDTLLPLQVGATICIPDRDAMARRGHLATWIRDARITVCHMTPAMNEIVTTPLPGGACPTFDSLRLVTFLGAPLRGRDVVRLRAFAPAAQIVNSYGATETQRAVANYIVPDDRLRAHEVYPVGRGIEDVQLLVINGEGRQAGIGELGEIWFRSPHVALGYLGDDALTLARFRPDPISGDRAYRTGDLGRYLLTGEVRIHGRTDFQIKIRGFRVEPGEIEAVLLEHPNVRAAVVMARDRSDEQLLVAYVCLSGSVAITALRAFVAERLPDYMVPSAFVVLDNLPLTPNRKLDRDALPAPSERDFPREIEVAPRTSTEHAVASVWREVLGIQSLGIHDNFFALGGNSLLVLRLLIRVSERFGVDMSARSVYETPTIAEQAARIDGGPRSKTPDAAVERALYELVSQLSEDELREQLAAWSRLALDPVPARSHELAGPRRELFERLLAQHSIDAHTSLPLARGAVASGDATVAERLHWDVHERGNFPALSVHAVAFTIRGRLDRDAAQQAIATLVQRQAALRTIFDCDRGKLRRHVQDRGPSLELIDLDVRGDVENRLVELFEEHKQPHDLRRYVFRAWLIRVADDHHLLFLSPHHIVLDGFSYDVLLSDLAALYRAFASGKQPTLPALTLEYNDFCFWQTTLPRRPLGRQQLEFWAGVIAGYQGLELPGDRRQMKRGAVGMAIDTYVNGAVPIALEGAAWNAIERLCARMACSPYVAVATGFLLLLTRWGNRSDVICSTGNFHRNRPGSEAVVGNFVCPYPLRVTFDETGDLAAAVRTCHEAILLHREHAHVAPETALDLWPEWSRFNLNYLIEPFEQEEFDFGDVRLARAFIARTEWSAKAGRTGHDVALFLRQRVRGLRGNLVYNAERFSPELAERAARRLVEILAAIATDGEYPLTMVPRGL